MSDIEYPTIRLVGAAQRERAKGFVDVAPHGYVVIVKEETRTLEQNAKMWPMLDDISKQVIWHGMRLSKEEWKDFATATLKSQKFVPNIDGNGFIAVGGRTSKMGKRAFSDLIEMLYMIGSKNEVAWSGKAIETIDEYASAG